MSSRSNSPTADRHDTPTTVDDLDPRETREWIESLESVLERDGPERARFLLERVAEEARGHAAAPRLDGTTAYVNTLRPEDQPAFPGDPELEERLLALLRWNAMAMVVKANKDDSGLGGHIASYASAAYLYETGFHHFWNARSDDHGGDLVYIQGHSSPGIYARAFLEGRLSEEQLERFRREVEPGGLSSYPHSWLMGDFWQFATVSMGLGPLMAIYQARFMKYLHLRGLADNANRHVWAFLGDGETDEPESLGALSIAARERLGNLVFVINCNLQRLDGPVRGNGKIIQELERIFRGAGWRVIKVVWSSAWDELLAQDHDGKLKRRLMEIVDGVYQNVGARDGAYLRQAIFSQDQELAARVAHWTDDELRRLQFGGHDFEKVYAAFHAAVNTQDQPVVILTKTVKGFGLGAAGEGLNTSHQAKKLDAEAVAAFQKRFGVPIPREELEELPFYRPQEDSEEIRYLKQHRETLGGSLPARHPDSESLPVPDLDAFGVLLKDSGERELSTTMAFVRFLAVLGRQKDLAPHLVPIIADEARTFGMEGMFRQMGIYSPLGQLYEPVDADQLAFYKEAEDGQILQEGINEAGSLASWVAAGTSYANHGVPMVPFFIFYSMFGFQRVMDLIWAGADMQARGFLIGATSGRTTLNGEGLQHQDGHSHLMAAAVPTCRAYDPTYAYEMAVILQDGLRRMAAERENVFYYITSLNENYPHPALPEGAEEGILKGLYRLHDGGEAKDGQPRVQLLGSGAILREVEAAAAMLAEDHGIQADVWSATSFTELRRDALAADREALLQPEAEPRESWIGRCLGQSEGPVIAATDYMKSFADQIRAWVPRPYHVLGTDGFGRSDTREQLRDFFEVDRRWITVAALKALADEGTVPAKVVAEALERYGIDPATPDPVTR